MCSTAKINPADDKTLVILLPGYKSNNQELLFLKDSMEKKRGTSFVCLPYQLIGGNGERPIKQISEELIKQIRSLLLKHEFNHCYLIGYSLGSALALNIVVDYPNMFSGLVLISMFDDRKNLLLNRGIILAKENDIKPISLIEKTKRTNLLFIHGTSDKSIAIERAIKVFKKSNKKYSKFISIPDDHYFSNDHSKAPINKSISEFLKLNTNQSPGS